SSRLSAKIPNPPILTNGKDLPYKHWDFQMSNKLIGNADWYEKMSYIIGRIAGKALDHLYSHMEANGGRAAFPGTDIFAFLRTIFVNPLERYQAKNQLRSLKYVLGNNITNFINKFYMLANQAQLPHNEWKDELHDKLPSSLQLPLTTQHLDTSFDFEEY
ncbi:hypothetical protein K469DRAFT_464658, partial [Zopfia rhizophila CBS 207.26]